MRRITGASLNGSRPAHSNTSAWRGEKLMRSIPKRARANRLAAVAMNSMAQQAVPNGMGQSELARDQLHAEPLVGGPDHRHARLVRTGLDGGRALRRNEMRQAKHAYRVDDHEDQQNEERGVLSHPRPQ